MSVFQEIICERFSDQCVSWKEAHVAHVEERTFLYRTLLRTYSQVSVYENGEVRFFPSKTCKRMTKAPEVSHSYVIFMSTNFVSNHFGHADYEYAIGFEQSLEYRKIQGQKHFRRFFMFFLVCFVFDDYFSDIKLKKRSRRHEYCLKFRALQNS
jgi:hypothetical protein